MRQYLATVLGIWIAACIAAYFFSQQYHIPLSLTSAIVPAFLLELAFYAMPGFEGIRQRFAGFVEVAGIPVSVLGRDLGDRRRAG